MTRRTFPDYQNLLYGAGPIGSSLASMAGRMCTVYLDAAATNIALDLQLQDGTPVSDGRFLIDPTSRVPTFKGPPSGAAVLYCIPDGTSIVSPLFADAEEILAKTDARYPAAYVVTGADPTGATSSDAAFTAARDAVFASAVTDPETGLTVAQQTIYVPPGRYLLTNPGSLLNTPATSPTGPMLGFRITGSSRETTKIVFAPTAAGALLINANRFLHTHISDITFVGGNSNATFYQGIAGGSAQNATWERITWTGTWQDGFNFGGDSSANLMSEHTWLHCSAHGTYAGAFFNCGTGSGGISQDNFLNYDFLSCDLEITSGDIFRFVYGGSLNVYGGSLILLGTGTVLNLPTPTHASGSNRYCFDGTRVELHSTTSKWLDSKVKYGNAVFKNVTFDGYPTASTTIVSTVYGSNDSGLMVRWENCRLLGLHEYQYDGTSFNAAGARVVYDTCTHTQFLDLQDMLVHTNLAGTGAAGGRQQVDFLHCQGGSSYGSNGADRVYDVAANWLARKNGEARRMTRSLKDFAGKSPGSGSAASIDVWMPMNCYITAVHFIKAAGGASAVTSWSLVLSTNDSTPLVVATCAPGTAWNAGFKVHVNDIYLRPTTDARRHLTLTVTGGIPADLLTDVLIDYLPGS